MGRRSGRCEDGWAIPQIARGVQVQDIVLGALRQREGRAVTFTLFSDYLKAASRRPLVEGLIRRVISEVYARHYLQYGGGTIVTGIHGLGYYDRLSTDFPLFDVQILKLLLGLGGFREILDTSWAYANWAWESVRTWRGVGYHGAFRDQVKVVLGGLVGGLAREDAEGSHRDRGYRLRKTIISMLERVGSGVGVRLRPVRRMDEAVEVAFNAVAAITAKLRGMRQFSTSIEQAMENQKMYKCDILLVTVTEVELRAVLRAAANRVGHS